VFYTDDKEFHTLLFYLIRLLLKLTVFTVFLQARDVTSAHKMTHLIVQKHYYFYYSKQIPLKFQRTLH